WVNERREAATLAMEARYGPCSRSMDVPERGMLTPPFCRTGGPCPTRVWWDRYDDRRRHAQAVATARTHAPRADARAHVLDRRCGCRRLPRSRPRLHGQH